MSAKERERKKEAYLEALEKSLGIMNQACKISGIHISTIKDWRRRDPKFQERIDEIKDIAIDFAESHLFSAIKRGNVAAIIFFLKTRGRERGYIEKFDHSIKELPPVEIIEKRSGATSKKKR